MNHKFITLITFAAALFTVGQAQAQSAAQSKRSLELTLGLGTINHKTQPFEFAIDANHQIFNRCDLHILCETNWMHPKESVTKDYNRSTNLGLGLSYELGQGDDADYGVFEVRASGTESVDNSTYKHTSYKLGLYWYGLRGEKSVLVPIIGVGFADREFHRSGIPSYRGAFLSLGIRL
jgi:hypothetical protein